MLKRSYQYNLPQELIAAEPITPRDHSRLFVYHTNNDEILFDRFVNLYKHLPEKSLMVLNETKVAPSRITLYKKSGGGVVCLVLLNEPHQKDSIRIMVDRKIELGETLFLHSKGGKPLLNIYAHAEKSIFVAKLLVERTQFISYLNQNGVMPIPPYLKHTNLTKSSLKRKYQTTFRRENSSLCSVAAPTASLHFTPRVLRSLDAKHIQEVKLTLEVGLGTFAPVTPQNMEKGELHTEWYLMPERTQTALKLAREEGRPIIAVGTTTVRAIESHSASHLNTENCVYTPTNIFIKPGFAFRYVNSLITNFHLPESSLMMLVEALLKHKRSRRSIVDLYKIAIQEGFRFFSFGDAMLIL